MGGTVTSDNTTPSDYGKIVGLLLEVGLLSEKQVQYALRVRSKIKSHKSLLEIIRELDYLSEDQIRETLRQNSPSLRIGEFLVEMGMIGQPDLELALKLQAEETPTRKLGEVLVAHNLIEERKLIGVLSIQLGFPFIDPDSLKIDPDLFKRGSISQYREHNFVPVRLEDGKVLVAFADPMDPQDVEAATNAMCQSIIPAITTKLSIKAAIDHLHPEKKIAEYILSETDESVVEIVDAIIAEAIETADVSDIHIDPLADRLRVRFRLDGVLVPYKEYPMNISRALSTRIKVLCKADIVEKQRHQEGRILFDNNGHPMDIRVSFYATVKGEKIVLRLLNRQTELPDIDQIGMSRRVMRHFREDALDRPSGVVLITGPAGSGKTTTVYSCINHLNTMETSIITAEDPVEYVIDGIGQCAIDPKINLTFEDSLRHMMRQDPDIIVIGEIQDASCAEVAVHAALTGHKVLTTLHTEDSIGGLLRLLNMDIDAFLISSTVVCVVAQRLLRRVCSHCALPYELRPRDLLRIGCDHNHLEGAAFRKGHGCEHCRYTGYRKRVAAFEVLVLNDAVRDALIQRKTSQQIRHVCTQTTGLVTLFEDGLYKAARGITTVEETMRCLPRFQKPRPLGELERLIGK
jgi:type IV pilus assembly protein PilB